jgi:hypothetical protein
MPQDTLCIFTEFIGLTCCRSRVPKQGINIFVSYGVSYSACIFLLSSRLC